MSGLRKHLVIGTALLTATALGGVPTFAQELPKDLADALAGKFKGTVVTAFGAFADADQVKFDENVKAFEQKTGIDIQYESTKQFEATISTRVDAGNVPDIVDFPQPGLMGNLARAGKLASARGSRAGAPTPLSPPRCAGPQAPGQIRQAFRVGTFMTHWRPACDASVPR